MEKIPVWYLQYEIVVFDPRIGKNSMNLVVPPPLFSGMPLETSPKQKHVV